MKRNNLYALIFGLLTTQAAFALQSIKVIGDPSSATDIVSFEATKDQILLGALFDTDTHPGTAGFRAQEPKADSSTPKFPTCSLSSSSPMYPLGVRILTNFQKGALLKVTMQNGVCLSISLQRTTADSEQSP